MRSRILLAAPVLALGLISCEHAKRHFALPAAPKPAVAKSLPKIRIETPPEIETYVPMVEIPMPEMKVAPFHQAAQTKPPAVHSPPVQATSPEAPPPIPPPVVLPAPVPRLGEILTADRRKEYEKQFSVFVGEAQTAVDRASGRQLTRVQREMLARIRVFLQQAAASKGNDLPTALQLARRADLLGQDLVKSLR